MLLLTAAALACGLLATVLPASAHDGQDPRPGAARVDLETLLTTALSGETSSGGRESSVAVDRSNNVIAAALKETAQPLATENFQDLGRSPAGVDTLVPGGLSTAAASDDAGHSYVAEAYGATVLLTTVTATDQDALVTDGTVPLAVGAGARHRVRLDATGNAATTGRLYLLATGATGEPAVWSGPVSRLTGTSVALPDAHDCTLTADHRRGSRVVYAACLSTLSTTVLWVSRDAGATFRPMPLPMGNALDPSSVSVGPDGTAWVLSTAGSLAGPATSSQLLLHHVLASGKVTTQDLTSERGLWRGAVLDVSHRGRLGVVAYPFAPGATGVQVTVPGASAPLLRNVWSVRTLSS